MSRRVVVEEPCEHGRVGWHVFPPAYGGRDTCPGGSRTVLEGIPDPDDVKAALDWFGDQWRPLLPPEEQLIGHLAWKRVRDAAVWVAAVFGGTP